MSDIYSPQHIEPKWQDRWEADHVFVAADPEEGAETAYILDMFPYPSGSGLHVGHLLGYTGSDVMARAARMQGKQVLHPMGWDAFGLPAENYALKTGVHPAVSTEKNIATYKQQIHKVGLSYDWSREITTSDPSFYRWTQWLFRLMYNRGLAYRKEGMVNWCPKDQTVLANEQVVGGLCDRCGTQVEQRNLRQWYFKITDYADRLIDDLDTIAWPDKIKHMQRNWIGRSVGATVAFTVEGSDKQVQVFTTRVDTIFGATYLVLAPEHPLVSEITTDEQRAAVTAYCEATSKKTELEREHLEKTKTGVWSGAYAINPATQERIPIWIADYVLVGYGTGAIMAVPAHDERDAEFAHAFSLPSRTVVSEDGTLVASGEFTGKKAADAIDAIIAAVNGKREVRYRLRDWLVSRQRYWGCPIPVLYDEAGNEVLLDDAELPVTLPMNVEFSPTGLSPLFTSDEWRTVQRNGQMYTREADTLDGFVCSSWYYLRYCSPGYQDGPFDPDLVKRWLPVQDYIGGAEHAVMHLLYARFITKVLYDAGYVTFQEPFARLRNQGMILGPDHNKMSKSKGNVINPDDVIAEYGADTLRIYELFMAPFELEKPWDTKGILGVRRFLEKFWRLQHKLQDSPASADEQRVVHHAIKKVTEDVADCAFNTAISTFMETVNALQGQTYISKSSYLDLVRLLCPFAPHLAEELWERLGQHGYCARATWPSYDEKLLVRASVEYPVQINGKVRARVHIGSEITNESAIQQVVEQDPQVKAYLEGAVVRKVIVVPGRLVSYVVGTA